MIKDVKMGLNVTTHEPVNLYGCDISDNVMIGTFVEIQNDVVVGKNSRIQSHTFLCSGVRIGEDVFIGHGVMFINDLKPKVNNLEFKLKRTIIEDKVSIGSNATILPVRIGKNAIIGAGSVVINNVPNNVIVAGNPAKIIGINL